MASVINSRAHDIVASDAFVRPIERALDEHVPIFLLVLRVPAFAQLAWNQGKRIAVRHERETEHAFRAAARRILRRGDALAHDRGSDWFAVAMLEPARDGSPIALVEARAAIERIAAAITSSTGRAMQIGWLPIDGATHLRDFPTTIERALERGHRERERYEFLAAVGHELRTPLTSIRGYLETLLDADVDAPTARRFIETARKEALRLGRIVDGMLEFSLLDLSAVGSVDARTAVESLVGAALDALAPIAAEREIRLVSRCEVECYARLDGDACMHALVNLVENAIKHGRPRGRVEVSVSECDGFVEIAVDDDGPGVAPSDRDAIFGMRVRGPDRGAGGSGIGLAIVRTIAERAGGEVVVARSHLGGAQFRFRVPARRAQRAESAALLS